MSAPEKSHSSQVIWGALDVASAFVPPVQQVASCKDVIERCFVLLCWNNFRWCSESLKLGITCTDKMTQCRSTFIVSNWIRKPSSLSIHLIVIDSVLVFFVIFFIWRFCCNQYLTAVYVKSQVHWHDCNSSSNGQLSIKIRNHDQQTAHNAQLNRSIYLILLQ